MITSSHQTILQSCYHTSGNIIYSDLNITSHIQTKLDGSRGVEGVRIVVGQIGCFRNIDIGNSAVPDMETIATVVRTVTFDADCISARIESYLDVGWSVWRR